MDSHVAESSVEVGPPFGSCAAFRARPYGRTRVENAVVILPARDAPVDVCALEREAAALLADAMATLAAPAVSGRRDRHRRQLDRAIEIASETLSVAGRSVDANVSRRARLTLLKAYVARAEDARHGAGQLSLGAQRAPTCDDCEDGWKRVQEIVGVAEASAAEAARVAADIGTAAASKALRAALAAAQAAREIILARNHAYTFHAEPGFSFGEGWYLAAAAVLAGVAIQIESDKPQTAQAERFLRDAGLVQLLVPYRSRPRANKHLPEIVARAFRENPTTSQQDLRRAFLGAMPIPSSITEWIDTRLAQAPAASKVLLWLRYGKHQPNRNSSYAELVSLADRARTVGLVPILVGDGLPGGPVPTGAVDMTLFWKEAIFQGIDMRRAQLQFFEHLRRAHALVGQLGVTTAGMDGPALLGLATMYLTDAPNPRLGSWVGAVPGYEEIVRAEGYLDRITARLRHWAGVGLRGAGPKRG